MADKDKNTPQPIDESVKEYVLKREKYFEELCENQFNFSRSAQTPNVGKLYLENFNKIKSVCEKEEYNFRWIVVNDDECDAPLPLTLRLTHLLTWTDEQDTKLLQLAKLAELLANCNKSGVRLTGTSKKGELMCCLTDRSILAVLLACVHAMIDEERHRIAPINNDKEDEYEWSEYWEEQDWEKDPNHPNYWYDREWKIKKPVFPGESFFVEPYTHEEIDQIIKYESLRQDKLKCFTSISIQGNTANRILHELIKAGIPVDKSERGQLTKVFAFTYDIMYHLGFIVEDESEFETKNRNEKFQLIKQRLAAFGRDAKKTGL